MPIDDAQHAALDAEFERLKLDKSRAFGGLVVTEEDVPHLLAHVRALNPPVTWRDVIPDIPAHWIEGRPETWTRRYKPLGPYDYQSLPTGAAFHVHWPRPEDPKRLERLVAEARKAGWPVFGAGFIEIINPDWPTDAFLVLDCDADKETIDEFFAWLTERTDVELAAIPRSGRERYVDDSTRAKPR